MAERPGLLATMYVSRSLISMSDADAEVARILADARPRNLAARVTGALLFSGTRFAQALEGPHDAVRHLLSRIGADKRHEQVRVLYRREVDIRDFPTWGMAYLGRFPGAERHIAAAAELDEDLNDATADALLDYMIAGSSAEVG